jgi:hypothetical protein
VGIFNTFPWLSDKVAGFAGIVSLPPVTIRESQLSGSSTPFSKMGLLI